jgi:DNA-binding phage protein
MSSDQQDVRHSDTLLAEERGAVSALLEANADRRDDAEAESRAAKQELQELLLRGQAAGIGVTEMARKGRVSRDTAHRTLKEGGGMTWKAKEAWAGEIMARIPGGDRDRNDFRMYVNMFLLKALGANPEGLPQSVKGVLDEAAEAMRTIGGRPAFDPEYDQAIRDLPWPTS